LNEWFFCRPTEELLTKQGHRASGHLAFDDAPATAFECQNSFIFDSGMVSDHVSESPLHTNSFITGLSGRIVS